VARNAVLLWSTDDAIKAKTTTNFLSKELTLPVNANPTLTPTQNPNPNILTLTLNPNDA